MSLSSRRFITGLPGPCITSEDQQFLQATQPCGLILFARNCEEPKQVQDLILQFKDAIDFIDPLILIDQEGGRVQRLGPPLWHKYPPAAHYGTVYQQDKARGLRYAYLGAQLMAYDLMALGINMNCAPVLDIHNQSTTDALGDRIYSSETDAVVALAQVVMQGFLEQGIIPIMKHMPGHGRAVVDSHVSLPKVDASLEDLVETDFASFKALSHCPAAMTAHIIFEQIDGQCPATQSAKVIQEIIRDYLGFEGILMSDDLHMGALSGTIAQRAQKSIAAGCDLVLYCNPEPEDRIANAQDISMLNPETIHRIKTMLSAGNSRPHLDHNAIWNEFISLAP